MTAHHYELLANLDSAEACATQLASESISDMDRRMLADQLRHDLAETRRLLPVVNASTEAAHG